MPRIVQSSTRILKDVVQPEKRLKFVQVCYAAADEINKVVEDVDLESVELVATRRSVCDRRRVM